MLNNDIVVEVSVLVILAQVLSKYMNIGPLGFETY